VVAISHAGDNKDAGYTENGLCRKNNCINPLVPGLDDLPRLEKIEWQCATNNLVTQYMSFCQDVVNYDPALPSPNASTPVTQLVKSQEDAAITMFAYHLSGMGYDYWDYREPAYSDSDCVRSVWKMVCFTYFPKASAGCKVGEQSIYKRPCRSSCQNYFEHCGVDCCDESVQCTFNHVAKAPNGSIELIQTGYVNIDGPSAFCTGTSRQSVRANFFLLLAVLGMHLGSSIGATAGIESSTTTGGSRGHRRPGKSSDYWRSMRASFRRHALLGVLIVAALSLQGCAIDRHLKANWEQQPNYLGQLAFRVPELPRRDAVLNSCSQNVSALVQCNGRGYCKSFASEAISAQYHKPFSLCMCEPEWAGPECTVRRKSQITAFSLSLFFGVLGADYFYLGFPLWGMVKLLTAGGLGFWWLIDVIRTASGPVYAYQFRTAADLPHWVALCVIFLLASLVGFAISIEGYMIHRKAKRDDATRQTNGEMVRHFHDTKNKEWRSVQESLKLQYGSVNL
jgi:hypothetical protein